MRHPVVGTCRDTATGQVRGSATVSVYIAGGVVAASIYTSSTGGSPVNSVESDSSGKFLFYIDDTDYALNQLFKIVTSKTGYDDVTYDYLPFFSFQCLSTDETFADASDKKIPTQKAVKDYVDTVVAGIEIGSGDLPAATAENDFISANGSFEWVKKTLAEVITILGLSDYVPKSLFDANTILSADSDNTPAALTVAEQRIVGRKTGGNITALTASEVKTILEVTEADITTSDITTNNVSTSKHGLVPKAPNDTSKYLRGDGSWSTVSTSIPDGVVSQAKLKTSSGSVSKNASGYTNATLPGGEYGFYPRTQVVDGTGTGDRNHGCQVHIFYQPFDSSNYGSSSAACYIGLVQNSSNDSNVTIYAYQRYVTSSGEVHWIFILRDKTTKKVTSIWEAPDHPCFGNGGKPSLMPHPFPGYDLNTQEIIVINPSKQELQEIDALRYTDEDDVPDLQFIQVIEKYYEIDETSSPKWPETEVTVGLPEGYDWQMAKAGDLVTPIKKVIPQPENVLVRSLKLKKT